MTYYILYIHLAAATYNYALLFTGMSDWGARLKVPFLLSSDTMTVTVWFRTNMVESDTVIFMLTG